MKLVRVLPAAEEEVAAAGAWYESQRVGLGVEYIAELDATLERVQALPESFPLWRSDRPYRKAQLHRFPYLVFFRICGDEIEVVAVPARLSSRSRALSLRPFGRSRGLPLGSGPTARGG